MKRFFDINLALILILIFFIPILIIALIIFFTSQGPIIYWSKRVGRNNTYFYMPKFRTMYKGSPVVATHLLKNPDDWVTPFGSFLRRTSLDELPQLWSILIGTMTFVGPRPALFNQNDLIEMRTSCGVHKLSPGLTGWAQINGRDEVSIAAKVKLDHEYLLRKSLLFDLWIILITIIRSLSSRGISH